MNILHGDCLETLKTLPDNYVDSVVTDPPYGLKFMGKKWDYDVPSRDIWIEVLRVLKPCGHLLSFGGTRTYHRMVVAIEDAGFEIRDQIQWLYGSGFPKSQNVAIQIDKQAGVIGNRGKGFNAAGQGVGLNQNKELRSDHPDYVAPSAITEEAKQWQGWGTALKPANEPIVLARKPLEKGLTVNQNVLKWGCGALNIDASRIGTQNTKSKHCSNANQKKTMGAFNEWDGSYREVTQGRWPANVLLDERAAEMLDLQSGPCKTGNIKAGTLQGFGKGANTYGEGCVQREFQTDAATGASRFFYVAKASKRERNAGLEGITNGHPTIKPIRLMEYLIKLVTPPTGIVLDPFMGSGSTGVAAHNLGFGFIGCEMNDEYIEIAKKRIANDY